jgi:hypothetical protein
MDQNLLQFYKEFTDLVNRVEKLEKELTKHKPKRTQFVKPTKEEVAQAFNDKGYKSIHADGFMNHYESNGWKVGKNSMKDWKATVNQWVARMKEKGMKPDKVFVMTPLKEQVTLDEAIQEKKDPLAYRWEIINRLKAGNGTDLEKNLYRGYENIHTDEDLNKYIEQQKEMRAKKERSEEGIRKFNLAQQIAQDGVTNTFTTIS